MCQIVRCGEAECPVNLAMRVLKGVLRSSEFRNIDAVVKQLESEFTNSNQWRTLKLLELVNKVRYGTD